MVREHQLAAATRTFYYKLDGNLRAVGFNETVR